MAPELLLQLFVKKEIQIDQLVVENDKLRKENEKLKAELTLLKKDNQNVNNSADS